MKLCFIYIKFFKNLHSGSVINIVKKQSQSLTGLRIPTRHKIKQADVNQTRLCLAAFVPGTELFKKAAERCCTQLFAGDDLQSTRWAWHPATFDKPYNLLCRSLLLRFCQKQCQQTRVQKVRKVLYQNICQAFLDGKTTESYERGLGQIH